MLTRNAALFGSTEWRISLKHHVRIHFLSAISALGEMFPIGTTRPTSRPKAFLLIKDVHVYEWLDIFSLISAAVEVYSERAPPSPLSRVVCRGGEIIHRG